MRAQRELVSPKKNKTWKGLCGLLNDPESDRLLVFIGGQCWSREGELFGFWRGEQQRGWINGEYNLDARGAFLSSRSTVIPVVIKTGRFVYLFIHTKIDLTPPPLLNTNNKWSRNLSKQVLLWFCFYPSEQNSLQLINDPFLCAGPSCYPYRALFAFGQPSERIRKYTINNKWICFWRTDSV